MVLRTLRIGSAVDIHQYDDGSFDSAIETDQPIKAGSPIDSNDVLRKVDIGALVGDVIGPAASTDNAVVRFNGTTGKSIQNSGVLIDDSDNVTFPSTITIKNPNGPTYDSLFSTGAISPNDILYIDSKGGIGGWNGAIQFRISYNNGALVPVMTIGMGDGSTNVGIGAITAFGSNAAKVLGMAIGTAPTSSPIDMVQSYVTDLSAGNAILRVRMESGAIISFPNVTGNLAITVAEYGSSLPDLTVPTGATRYMGFWSGGVLATTDIWTVPVTRAGTLKNLYVQTITAQPAGGTLVFTVMVSGAATSIVITVAAGGAAATHSDLTNTAAVVVGDKVSLKVVNNDGAAASAQIRGFGLEKAA